MLNEEEKKEMLADAADQKRKEDFRRSKPAQEQMISFDEYVLFLNSVQKIFSPFPISQKPTKSANNKL